MIILILVYIQNLINIIPIENRLLTFAKICARLSLLTSHKTHFTLIGNKKMERLATTSKRALGS